MVRQLANNLLEISIVSPNAQSICGTERRALQRQLHSGTRREISSIENFELPPLPFPRQMPRCSICLTTVNDARFRAVREVPATSIWSVMPNFLEKENNHSIMMNNYKLKHTPTAIANDDNRVMHLCQRACKSLVRFHEAFRTFFASTGSLCTVSRSQKPTNNNKHRVFSLSFFVFFDVFRCVSMRFDVFQFSSIFSKDSFSNLFNILRFFNRFRLFSLAFW